MTAATSAPAAPAGVRRLDYHVVDVFTATPFAGNPLAVLLDADGVPTPALQALAREFHLSETAAVLAPSAPGADYRVRIFTPQEELPFAGHPSIGTAWLLRHLGRLPGYRDEVVQQCGAGLLPLTFLPPPPGADPERAPVRLTGAPAQVAEPLDPHPLLHAAGLGPQDLAGPPPRTCGTGISFTVLPVRPDALAGAEPDLAAVRALGGAGLAVVGLPPSPGAGPVRQRVFAAGAGVAEDPATGSAVTALGAFLVTAGWLPGEGESSFQVLQGVELGRPSRLEGSVLARSGAPVRCRVAGQVVPVATGTIVVPGPAPGAPSAPGAPGAPGAG